MTDGQRNGTGGWQPHPQGEYDADATAFVQLPEGAADAVSTPLAAPGHGYVPPQITVAPTAPDATDPAATGVWVLPPEITGMAPASSGGAQSVSWPDPGTQTGAHPQQQLPAEAAPDAYDPRDTGQWTFPDAMPSHPQEQGGAAVGHDVTGQWSIPVADGDLPDESGEFATSSLAEQWGGTPPATLPGGAPAPWAASWPAQAPEASEPPQASPFPEAPQAPQSLGYPANPANPANAAESAPAGHAPVRHGQSGAGETGGTPETPFERTAKLFVVSRRPDGSLGPAGQRGDDDGSGDVRDETGGYPADAHASAEPGSQPGPVAAPGATTAPAPGGHGADFAGGAHGAGPGYGGDAAAAAHHAPDVDPAFVNLAPGVQAAPAHHAPEAGGFADAGHLRDTDGASQAGLATGADHLPDVDFAFDGDDESGADSGYGTGHAHQADHLRDADAAYAAGHTHRADHPRHAEGAPSADHAHDAADAALASDAHDDTRAALAAEADQDPEADFALDAALAPDADPGADVDDEFPAALAFGGDFTPGATPDVTPTHDEAPAGDVPPAGETAHPAEAEAEAAAATAAADHASQAPHAPAPADPGADPGAHAHVDAPADTEADAPSTKAPPKAPEPGPVPQDEHPLVSYVLRVNGADRPVTDAWIGESLLYVLRERLGLAGAKDGCSQGECGACNVQVDGRLVASCLVPAATAAGSEVRTVEGLAVDGQPSDVQRALANCGAVQCGFCVPGMAMTLHDLLEGNPAPSDLETRRALCGNLCRCSGYRGVLDAVRDVVAEREAKGAANEQEQHQAGQDRSGQHQAGQHQAGQGGQAQPQQNGAPRVPHQAGPYGQDGGQA
ncbi:2Fe-2S iron-sulfur cluster-binding protein [Streptomyces aurantiacus]|uniref:2Fe-2S ferredoxin-type domain-containing protein n=1 Tax=Streptomyces aurantiacus JA 4570 TaxID=1286094 RepID=S4AGZ6_9ACTN|nr:2Fe-2S iron-sulfur cluster-binding protein [Streptomyces aurantiacus]EPH40767.1 hypothetical protein STRAU_6156 [Streptomyces aurantiacus JA 4570]